MMEVILREDVKSLGRAGEMVRVKPGYARNYLLPQGLAYPATEGNKKRIAAETRARGIRLEAEKGDAERLADALKDISLDVYESEFVCFLGPSGCGKTTLLRAIAGLDIHTAGIIEQADQDISALPPAERDFGIVFQSYALFPNMNVEQNVAYGLKVRKVPGSDMARRVSEMLEMMDIGELRDRGIDTDSARQMLTYGFGAEILERMELKGARDYLDDLVTARLEAV